MTYRIKVYYPCFDSQWQFLYEKTTRWSRIRHHYECSTKSGAIRKCNNLNKWFSECKSDHYAEVVEFHDTKSFDYTGNHERMFSSVVDDFIYKRYYRKEIYNG